MAIWFRCNRAVAHDVIFVLGNLFFMLQVYAFGMEIDQHFIAAILTVIGIQ
jgi:SecD/SecF fusion protein